jgi:hypothetical protein
MDEWMGGRRHVDLGDDRRGGVGYGRRRDFQAVVQEKMMRSPSAAEVNC